jgi:ribonuclease HI
LRLNDRSVQIFTDGSAIDNPGGKGGIAVIVHFPQHLQFPDEVICEIGYAESTNNRMELLACIKALEWVRKNKPWRDVTSVQIITDSRYVADNVGYRAWIWRKNKWRNQYGEPKENSDLWKKLLSSRQKAGMYIEFIQTKGKKSEILRQVDKAAKGVRDCGLEIDWGFRPGTVSRSKVKGAAKRFPAAGQIALIRPYRKKIMPAGEEKIRFDTLSEDGQNYVACFYAFATAERAAELHRQHGYRVRFNDDPNYPQILERIEEVPLPKKASDGNTRHITSGAPISTYPQAD